MPPLGLSGVAADKFGIVVIGGQTKRGHAVAEPGLHHRPLADRQNEAGLGLGEGRDAGEGGLGQAGALTGVGGLRHAASSEVAGTIAERSSTRIMRSSITVRARTTAMWGSEESSGGG